MASKTATIKAVVLGDVDNFKKGMREVADDAEQTGDRVKRDLNDSFDDLGEGAGAAEQKFIGLSDTITGTADVMEGLRTGNVQVLAMGLADLAGAAEALWASFGKVIANTWAKITATTADTAATATNTSATIGSRIASFAAAAAAKAHAAAQWVLNAALSANPIALVVIAIAGLVAAFVVAYKNVDWFRDLVDRLAGFFRDTLWPILQAVGGWIGSHLVTLFGYAADAVVWLWDKGKGAALFFRDNVLPVFRTVGGWFADTFMWQLRTAVDMFQWIWDKAKAVVDFVTSMPGKISNAASGMWDGIKNSFRGVINTIIGWWNNLSFGIPGWDPPGPGPKIPGFTLSTPNLPYLATGALVKGGQGGTLAVIGEGVNDEIVMPLPRGGAAGMGRTINVYVTAPVGSSSRDIGRELKRHLAEWERAS